MKSGIMAIVSVVIALLVNSLLAYSEGCVPADPFSGASDCVQVGVLLPGAEEDIPQNNVSSQQQTTSSSSNPLSISSVRLSPSRPAPGEKVTLKFKVSNSGNERIEDIDLTVDFDGLEDKKGNEIEADKTFSLSKGKERAISFTFDMPYDIGEGDTYDVNIRLEGRGEDTHTSYKASDSSKHITFKKESNALVIGEFKVSPTVLSCITGLSANYKLLNIGKNTLDVKVRIYNDELGLNYEKAVSIKESGSFEDTVRFNPRLSKGSYKLNIKAEYGTSLASDSAEFSINECGNEQEAVKEQPIKVFSQGASPTYASTSLASQVQPQNSITAYAVASPKKIDFLGSEEYTLLLIISVIILVGLIIYAGGAVVILLSKK
jgi:hypothetical protein